MSRRTAVTRGGLELVEEALRCLRREPALLAPYYVGTLPFVWGFLHFWTEMSRSAAAAQRCAPLALGLALLFAWMKLWQGVFAQAVLARRLGRPSPPLSLRRALSLLAVQTPIQATGVLVLPAAAVLALPFGWAYAFYQHASAGGPGPGGIWAAGNRAWRHAARAPRQNHVLLLVLTALGYFALPNVAAGLVALPYLAKGLLGVESPFTRSPWAFASTPFLAAVASLTFLGVDPLAKAAYALRHFYAEAEATGADLQADLRAATAAASGTSARPPGKNRRTALLVLGFALAGATSFPARAQEAALPSAQADEQGIAAPDLDGAIERVLGRSEYAWRLPPPAEPESSEHGWLSRFWDEAQELLSAAGEALVRALRTVLGWLARLFPEGGPKSGEPALWQGAWLKGLLLAALALVLAVLALLLLRRRAGRAAPADVQAATPAPDLDDDGVAADALPPEEWEALADDLLRQGEPRLGLRALFLGSLARLARNRLLTVARHKSNRDYEEELARRAGDDSGTFAAFAENVRLFEQVWYGSHAATAEVLGRFRENCGRILAHGR